VSCALTGALRGTSQEELVFELTWLGARFKDKLLEHGFWWDRGRVAQWSRCCATNRKVAGTIPAAVIGIFH